MIRINSSKIRNKRASLKTLVNSIVSSMGINVEMTEDKEEADVIIVQRMEDIKEELREDKIYLLVNGEMTEWKKEDLPENVFSGDDINDLKNFMSEIRKISNQKTGGYQDGERKQDSKSLL